MNQKADFKVLQFDSNPWICFTRKACLYIGLLTIRRKLAAALEKLNQQFTFMRDTYLYVCFNCLKQPQAIVTQISEKLMGGGHLAGGGGRRLLSVLLPLKRWCKLCQLVLCTAWTPAPSWSSPSSSSSPGSISSFPPQSGCKRPTKVYLPWWGEGLMIPDYVFLSFRTLVNWISKRTVYTSSPLRQIKSGVEWLWAARGYEGRVYSNTHLKVLIRGVKLHYNSIHFPTIRAWFTLHIKTNGILFESSKTSEVLHFSHMWYICQEGVQPADYKGQWHKVQSHYTRTEGG